MGEVHYMTVTGAKWTDLSYTFDNYELEESELNVPFLIIIQIPEDEVILNASSS